MTEYYEKNQALFKVERPLMKGLFIKVPLTAPQLGNVRRWYKTETREAVEHLEKYSLQNAVKYEYFYDKWVPVSEVLDMLPLKVPDVDEYLDKNRRGTERYGFSLFSECERLSPGGRAGTL